ncbi:MAG: glycosyltransferase [Acidimicrobiales bacterium]
MTAHQPSRLLVITPAHNEQATLGNLAQSMSEQTVRPDLWVIVDDRSVDDTSLVASAIEAEHGFAISIRVHNHADNDRHFTGKVEAFRAGYDQFASDDVDLIACVDADVILPNHYFERVLKEFEADPSIGVTGGVYIDPLGRVGRHGGGSVPGPAQTIRHQTYREIGGYRALPRGGEDALACAYARFRGWKTGAIEDLRFRHLRSQGTGGGQTKLRAAFDHGRQDWDVGIGPLFEVVRMVPRIQQRPYGFVVLSRLAGYLVGAIRRTRQVDNDILKFSRSEQRQRLLSPVRRYVGRS